MAKKKKFQAIKADTSDFKGVRHDGKDFNFDKNDTFVIEDEGIAREMDSMYGKKGSQKLAIAPFQDNETHEPGHRYTFAASRKYSEAWEAFEKRRKDKKTKKRDKRRKSAEE